MHSEVWVTYFKNWPFISSVDNLSRLGFTYGARTVCLNNGNNRYENTPIQIYRNFTSKN